MKFIKLFGEFFNKLRYRPTAKTDIITQNIARDKTGRWVADDKGQLIYKSDTPERIAKFTKAQEDRYAKLEEQIKSKCCQGSGVNCHCSPEKLAEKKKQAEAPKPKPFPKPTVNKKVEEVKAEAKRQQEKYGATKPVAKKKPTGGGTKKERPIE
jgi:hypothetical protein